ncbi:MAG: hypothetical protein UR12_C0004G0030 [candidate division TM6 bacterium GW2011_GWF2_30_66]|jgi:type II secretory pathway component PulC|nr:MAG: hypothetical protein UR12_C0004G0030 [candidate division TM6 bacterium GW2011_GWF2_30_66]
MRQPLWILNSVLFFLIIIILIFMFFSGVYIDVRKSIEPDVSKKETVKEISTVNIKKIYEPEDIFGTYKKVVHSKEKKGEIAALPEPPESSPVVIPEVVEPKFFDPLDLTLKGIVSIGNGSNSSAIISDNKTKREAVYKVGDKIEDAQLIRIFNNKIIFVRSNGQQEVFYLRERDAQSDSSFLNIDDWNGIVKKDAPNSYLVSKAMFADRIDNLAQFIELLHLTSAYYKGKSVGCRIGDIEKDSLGYKLGLKPGDIVLSVIGIEPINTRNRLEIYKKITELNQNDSFIVKVQRERDVYTLSYKLEEFVQSEKRVSLPGAANITPAQIKQEQDKMLREKYQFAPTENEIKRRDRQNMFGFGGKPMQQQNYKLAE